MAGAPLIERRRDRPDKNLPANWRALELDAGLFPSADGLRPALQGNGQDTRVILSPPVGGRRICSFLPPQRYVQTLRPQKGLRVTSVRRSQTGATGRAREFRMLHWQKVKFRSTPTPSYC